MMLAEGIIFSIPGQSVFNRWSILLACNKGICFNENIIKLAFYNVVESWTYFNIEQSLNMFKDKYGDWSFVLCNQVQDDLYTECLNLNFLNHVENSN